jgi:hypothetical protein
MLRENKNDEVTRQNCSCFDAHYYSYRDVGIRRASGEVFTSTAKMLSASVPSNMSTTLTRKKIGVATYLGTTSI